MPFVHHHAPHAKPGASDLCLAIQADQLLARGDVAHAVVLPEFAALANSPLAESPLHVGLLDGRPCWLCAATRPESTSPDGWQWHDTRSLLSVLTPDQAHALSCARQLLWWDRRHRYCGVCGTPTDAVVEERARRCPRCAATFFPVVSPAVIVAVTRGDELLLAHNRNFRPGMFSLLAGFVDPGETLEQAIVREIREEVSIEVDALQYVASQPWSYPNSLMLGFRARYVSGEVQVDGKEIEAANWYRRTSLPDLPRHGTVARQLIEAWRRE